MREVFNDAFSDNWHFLPVSKEEYQFSAKYLFFVTKPSLVIFIEKGDEPVGVLQCMLNINRILKPMKGRIGPVDYLTYLHNRNSIRELIIFAVGIKKTYQHTKVSRLILDCICRMCERYPVLYTTWMSDNNYQAVKTSEHLGLHPYKYFTIYEKSI